MVSSRPEAEWDETEQAWMLALDAYRRDEVCALCGWPKEVCQAAETEWALDVPPPTRCHVMTAIRRAQEGRASAGAGKHDDALLWRAQFKSPV